VAEVGEEGLIVLTFELEVSRTEVKGISNSSATGIERRIEKWMADRAESK